MGPGGDSAADRPPQRAALISEHVRLDLLTSPLGERHRRVENRTRKDDEEFLSPVASHAVDFPCRFTEQLGELAEYLIADLMAVAVVDFLEMIQVEKRHRKRLVQPRRVLEHLAQALLEVTPVVDAGERIGDRHATELVVGDREIALPLRYGIL
jgi:hypothetical protein